MSMLLHLSLHPPTAYSKAYRWQQQRPAFRPTVTKYRPYAEAKGFGSPVAMQEKKKQQEVGGGDGGEDDEDAIPQVVFDRMIVRIVVAVGSPMALGIGLIYLLGMLKERGVWDVPMWLPFVTTLALFGSSALGIAYGTLSTSLDPEKKGSLLGWEEAKQNWPEMWKEEE